MLRGTSPEHCISQSSLGRLQVLFCATWKKPISRAALPRSRGSAPARRGQTLHNPAAPNEPPTAPHHRMLQASAAPCMSLAHLHTTCFTFPRSRCLGICFQLHSILSMCTLETLVSHAQLMHSSIPFPHAVYCCCASLLCPHLLYLVSACLLLIHTRALHPTMRAAPLRCSRRVQPR